jgi:4-hydroxy-tetrahydrodipicolinate synthase
MTDPIPLETRLELIRRAAPYGIYTAIVTPFSDGNAVNSPINHKALNLLMERQIEAQIDGVVIAGCTGSASLLTHDEHVDLVKYAQRNFGGRIKIIAGDGSNSTSEARELATRVEQEAGVFTHLSISPYYNKPSNSGIIKHYETIADSIQGDLIIYSVPSRTGGKGLTPKIVEILSQHPNIVGIKDASGDLARVREIIERAAPRFSVLSGDDSSAIEIIRMGGSGLVSVASNIAPREIKKMTYLALGKDYENAERINTRLKLLYSALFPKSSENPSPNPVMCHYALRRLGYDIGVPRLPLCDGSEEEKQAMNIALENL